MIIVRNIFYKLKIKAYIKELHNVDINKIKKDELINLLINNKALEFNNTTNSTKIFNKEFNSKKNSAINNSYNTSKINNTDTDKKCKLPVSAFVSKPNISNNLDLNKTNFSPDCKNNLTFSNNVNNILKNLNLNNNSNIAEEYNEELNCSIKKILSKKGNDESNLAIADILTFNLLNDTNLRNKNYYNSKEYSEKYNQKIKEFYELRSNKLLAIEDELLNKEYQNCTFAPKINKINNIAKKLKFNNKINKSVNNKVSNEKNKTLVQNSKSTSKTKKNNYNNLYSNIKSRYTLNKQDKKSYIDKNNDFGTYNIIKKIKKYNPNTRSNEELYVLMIMGKKMIINKDYYKKIHEKVVEKNENLNKSNKKNNIEIANLINKLYTNTKSSTNNSRNSISKYNTYNIISNNSNKIIYDKLLNNIEQSINCHYIDNKSDENNCVVNEYINSNNLISYYNIIRVLFNVKLINNQEYNYVMNVYKDKEACDNIQINIEQSQHNNLNIINNLIIEINYYLNNKHLESKNRNNNNNFVYLKECFLNKNYLIDFILSIYNLFKYKEIEKIKCNKSLINKYKKLYTNSKNKRITYSEFLDTKLNEEINNEFKSLIDFNKEKGNTIIIKKLFTIIKEDNICNMLVSPENSLNICSKYSSLLSNKLYTKSDLYRKSTNKLYSLESKNNTKNIESNDFYYKSYINKMQENISNYNNNLNYIDRFNILINKKKEELKRKKLEYENNIKNNDLLFKPILISKEPTYLSKNKVSDNQELNNKLSIYDRSNKLAAKKKENYEKYKIEKINQQNEEITNYFVPNIDIKSSIDLQNMFVETSNMEIYNDIDYNNFYIRLNNARKKREIKYKLENNRLFYPIKPKYTPLLNKNSNINKSNLNIKKNYNSKSKKKNQHKVKEKSLDKCVTNDNESVNIIDNDEEKSIYTILYYII